VGEKGSRVGRARRKQKSSYQFSKPGFRKVVNTPYGPTLRSDLTAYTSTSGRGRSTGDDKGRLLRASNADQPRKLHDVSSWFVEKVLFPLSHIIQGVGERENQED